MQRAQVKKMKHKKIEKDIFEWGSECVCVCFFYMFLCVCVVHAYMGWKKSWQQTYEQTVAKCFENEMVLRPMAYQMR